MPAELIIKRATNHALSLFRAEIHKPKPFQARDHIKNIITNHQLSNKN